MMGINSQGFDSKKASILSPSEKQSQPNLMKPGVTNSFTDLRSMKYQRGYNAAMAATRVFSLVAVLAFSLTLLAGCSRSSPEAVQGESSTQAFAREVERALPQEALYDYHKRLTGNPVHTA